MPFAPSSASAGSHAFPFSPERRLTWALGSRLVHRVPPTPPGSPQAPGHPGTPTAFLMRCGVWGATCCFAVSCVSPSLLPWEGGSFHGQGGRALSPRPGLWGALWAVRHSPDRHPAGLNPVTAEGPLPHHLAIRPLSAQASPPGPREQWTLAPSRRNTRVSRPGASAPQPPSWGWVSRTGLSQHSQGSCRRLVTSGSSLLPSGPAQQLEAFVAEPSHFVVAQSLRLRSWCSQVLVPDSLRPHGLQHARPPCPSPSPGVGSNSSPWSQ